MSALLTANQFEKVFPEVITGSGYPANHATLQSFVVAIYVSVNSFECFMILGCRFVPSGVVSHLARTAASWMCGLYATENSSADVFWRGTAINPTSADGPL